MEVDILGIDSTFAEIKWTTYPKIRPSTVMLQFEKNYSFGLFGQKFPTAALGPNLSMPRQAAGRDMETVVVDPFYVLRWGVCDQAKDQNESRALAIPSQVCLGSDCPIAYRPC
jgi:hypothetical protein